MPPYWSANFYEGEFESKTYNIKEVWLLAPNSHKEWFENIIVFVGGRACGQPGPNNNLQRGPWSVFICEYDAIHRGPIPGN